MLIKIAQLLTALSFLVFIHELGHFLAAKAFGMRVNKFFIFFDAWGKKIWSKTIGETEYGIGWLPLGGYVQIAGMIDETQDASTFSSEPEPWEFRAKPAWQRFIVMIGGIVMNVIAGYLIFTMYMPVFEKEYLPMSEVNKYGIYTYPLAEEIGLQKGDKIVAINGKPADRYDDLRSFRLMLGGNVTVERNGGQKAEITVPSGFALRMKGNDFIMPMKQDVYVALTSPEMGAAKAGIKENDQLTAVNGMPIQSFHELKAILDANKNQTVQVTTQNEGKQNTLTVQVDSTGKLGFAPRFDFKKYYQFSPYTWGNALGYGFTESADAIVGQLAALGMMFTGKLDPRQTISSPIGIARVFPSQWDWARFWQITGLISLALAVMNMLPIPALDGGHMLFLGYEIVTRRRPSDKFLERAQVVGMIILLSLMVFAFGNDIYKAITGTW
jgi:regulator of sigma E protease